MIRIEKCSACGHEHKRNYDGGDVGEEFLELSCNVFIKKGFI